MSKIRDVLNRAYNAGAECSEWSPAVAEQEILDSLDPWISVEDILPEPNLKDKNGHRVNYWVWTKHGATIASYQNIARSEGVPVWYNYPSTMIVTHYQPLKEPK